MKREKYQVWIPEVMIKSKEMFEEEARVEQEQEKQGDLNELEEIIE